MARKRSRVHPRFKTKYRVRKGPEYDRALVRRGDITVWLHEEALAGWSAPPSRTRGRPKSTSQISIEAALALWLVYSLPWRQTEGLLRSLL